MYLDGDRLTLISAGYDYPSASNSADPYAVYGQTTVTVVDVSDRTAPKIIDSTQFDGTLLDSRAIGDQLYLVFQPTDLGSSLGGPNIVHGDGTPLAAGEDPYAYNPNLATSASGTAASQDTGYRYETEQEYVARITATLGDYPLPSFTSYDADGNQIAAGPVCDPSDVYKPAPQSPNQDFTTVATIDMASDQPGPTSTIMVPTGSNVTVYASTSSLYLLDSNTTAGTPTGIVLAAYGTPNPSVDSTSTTTIDQIDLVPQGGNLQLTAQGSVKGVVLDQFSADESGGYLRIATTEGTPGWSGTPDVQGNSQTHVFVLQQVGKSLDVVASLDNLAPGEEIYSVRFMAAEAFVVTYRRVDPLFAIDLSDPTARQARRRTGHARLLGLPAIGGRRLPHRRRP